MVKNPLDSFFESDSSEEYEYTTISVTIKPPVHFITTEEEDEDIQIEIINPGCEGVINKAIDTLKNEGAEELSRTEVGVVENFDDINNPESLIRKFDIALSEFHDGFKQNITVNFDPDPDQLQGGEQALEEEGFEYIIAQMENGIIIGGASNIIRNLCDELGFSPKERELIRLCYKIAVRESDVGDIKAHTSVDDVLFCWEEPRV